MDELDKEATVYSDLGYMVEYSTLKEVWEADIKPRLSELATQLWPITIQNLNHVSLIGIMEPRMIGVLAPAVRCQKQVSASGQFSFFHLLSQVKILSVLKVIFLSYRDYLLGCGSLFRRAQLCKPHA